MLPKRQRPQREMKQAHKTVALWLIIILMVLSILHFMGQQKSTSTKITFSEFMTAVQKNEIEKVTIQEEEYTGKFKPIYKEGAFLKLLGQLIANRPWPNLNQVMPKLNS
jgi:ATP-dependent Zn protease